MTEPLVLLRSFVKPMVQGFHASIMFTMHCIVSTSEPWLHRKEMFLVLLPKPKIMLVFIYFPIDKNDDRVCINQTLCN